MTKKTNSLPTLENPCRYVFIISCHTWSIGLDIIFTFPKFGSLVLLIYLFLTKHTDFSFGLKMERERKRERERERLLQTSGLLVHMLHSCHKTSQRWLSLKKNVSGKNQQTEWAAGLRWLATRLPSCFIISLQADTQNLAVVKIIDRAQASNTVCTGWRGSSKCDCTNA